MFTKYDIISLSEIKHCYPTSIPGFKYIRSRITPGTSHRGGVGVFISHKLWPDITNIDCNEDQVWFSLQNIPDTIFGCVYIPPRDSPFFNPQSFSTIQEKCKSTEKTLVMGDLNARLTNLEDFSSEQQKISYTTNPDKVTNTNGREMKSICIENGLKPVNHAQSRLGTLFY